MVLVPYDATGTSNDAVAARADAITVAQQIHAFASIGGPAQTPAYEDELARLHVLCLSCGSRCHLHRAPEQRPVLVGRSAHAVDTLLNEAFASWSATARQRRRLRRRGRPSSDHRRVFALVHYDQSPPIYNSLTAELDRRFGPPDFTLALERVATCST